MTVNAMKKDLAEYCAYIENHHEEFMLNIKLSTHKVYKSPLTFREMFGYDAEFKINGVRFTTKENDFQNTKNMKTLQIEEKKARELYKTASEELKKILEDTFGKDFLSEKVTDRIKTYEDACRELNEDPINESEMRRMGFTNDEISYRKIKTIVEALNEGWKADWENGDQKKWVPWFRVSPSGFVFYYTLYRYSYPFASYASRLCLKSDELATYAGKQFSELYRNLIM